ncbi:MAG: hypothetical protein EOP60_09970 [Sphingomonadales bacterium]|nr:MAG: hypothetical protein EOP60_09970 [Sphingomonadales bacterium]
MAIDTNNLFNQMVAAGEGLAGGIWQQMHSFAIPELKKIADQIGNIAGSGFKPEAMVELFKLQVDAAVAVIVAMTALAMQLVQDAINAILGAVKDLVNGAVGIPLIG